MNSQLSHKVDSVLQTMSLTDKVGEMTQLTIDMLIEDIQEEPHQLDPDKLREVLVEYRVGSILNVSGHAYPLEQWHHIIRQIQEVATSEKPTGIPVLYGIDTIHGANYTMNSTLFPQQIGLAATFNRELVREGARIAAYETRASWIPWTFSPVLGIGRDPRWPRFWETFGEDVLLASELGVAMVEGFQGEDPANAYRVAASAKHYLGYSLPASGHDRTVAWIPEIRLREYVLPSFKAAIDAGALTVMINSGEINGVPVHASRKLLTDLLRDELGFRGLAVSDWQDIHYLYTRHKVAKDYKEAIKMAVNAGVDMSMVPLDLDFPRLLKELVEEGEVPMERIDESVRRILRVKFLLGLFDKPYHPDTDYSEFGSDEFISAAYQSAAESITLLKNENDILPLSKNSNILVTGPTANSIIHLNGGWSRTWQGDDPQYNTPGKQTILEAIRANAGNGKVTYAEGTGINEDINIDAAVSAASAADVAVICIGEAPYTETPGDIGSLALPEPQRRLVREISATGTPVVLVLVEGRPRVINDIEPVADGILMAYLPAEEGGRATADILFGDVNPSGNLPFTYPRYVNDLVPYDHNYTDEVGPLGFNPQWPFGHGLSYTTFAYRNLTVSNSTFGPGEQLTISVEVTNIGRRSGKEIVQLYVSDHVASVTPPVKRLRGFDKISLEPGQQKTVSFTISAKDLAFVGRDLKKVTEPGDFRIQISDLEQTVTYRE
ncbi:MAG: glycoside hydrolase family 3 N-terminal domain-containing protein [Balneolaceae bacterium]|nr:glycoside hydrolase family 3 N-terminal domain-containing protein [Balneolaceae bacterium]